MLDVISRFGEKATCKPRATEMTVAQSDFRTISSNSTVAHAAFYKFYLKQRIEFLGYH